MLTLTQEMESEIGALDQLTDEPRLSLIDIAARHSVGQRNISELMSEEVATVSPQESLDGAARLILRHQVHRLPVVDDEQRLVGILSTMDLLAALVGVAPHARSKAAAR